MGQFYCSKWYDYIADNSLVKLNTHQPNLHFIVFMLTQSFNQKKKCEKWKRFSIKGFGVKFPPKSGCQVLLSKNIELQPSRLTTQTSVAKRGKIYITTKTEACCELWNTNAYKDLNSPWYERFLNINILHILSILHILHIQHILHILHILHIKRPNDQTTKLTQLDNTS